MCVIEQVCGKVRGSFLLCLFGFVSNCLSLVVVVRSFFLLSRYLVLSAHLSALTLGVLFAWCVV